MLAKKIAPAFHHVVNFSSSLKIIFVTNKRFFSLADLLGFNIWVIFWDCPSYLVREHLALYWLVIISLLMTNIAGTILEIGNSYVCQVTEVVGLFK